ncbi:MAG: fasciclin domain-containing protein [Planctomycetes bacterium]|nr:fasciclin domain-containing protein [Planctomycetota bacterium]
MKLGMVRVLALVAVGSLPAMSKAEDIVDTAVKAGQFNTLAAALKAANLVGTLKGPGPFTVFAPTDEAFAKLPAETVAELLKPENRKQLTDILTYHVVPGRVQAKDVIKLRGAVAVNGQRIDVQFGDEGVKVDGAKVLTTDIVCDNGVIHVIDSVILPSSKTIPETAKAAGSFETLLAAANAAGLAEVLGSTGPFTVFAPTDEAFGKLPAGTVETLLKPENKAQLVDILKYHVVPGRVYSEKVLDSKAIKTLQGASAAISLRDGSPRIQDAKILKTDIDASNGVIHIIDSVILPPPSGADAKRKLEEAVAKGATLFNAGHHSECVSVYRSTMNDLMSTSLPNSMKTHMSTVLRTADHTQCTTEQAWVLRRGIDQMYQQLATRPQ